MDAPGKIFHTRDGYKLFRGMPVWVWEDNERRSRVVGKIHASGKKFWYANPDPDGYVGARVDNSYAMVWNMSDARFVDKCRS